MWNRIEQGDNLDIMQTLPDASIDLIYCDILYGTGHNFKDYKDLPFKIDIIEAFYLPRLQEIYRLLKDTGSLYLHCDPTVSHYLKVLIDTIFGIKNFRNEIVWCYAGGGISKKDFPRKHDIILRYSKTDNYIYNIIYRLYSKGTLQRGRTKIKGKYAKLNSKGTPVNDWWNDISKITSPTDSEKLNYSNQKSEALLERIIKASSNKDDIVADFFCGCGTTPVVAKRLNRQYFACDISDRAIEITRKRINSTNPLRGFFNKE